MTELYSAWNEYFKPVAYPDQNILFLPEKKAYKVVYVEQIPLSEELVYDFGPLTAGEEKTGIELTDFFEMPDLELLQLRYIILDDIAVRMFQPGALGRYITKRKHMWIDKRSCLVDPSLKFTEFYHYKRRMLIFEVKNPTQYDTPKARIQFFGWRLVLEELATIPERYAAIPIGGMKPKE